MNIFKTLFSLLSAEVTATIVIKKTANGKMTVITNFSTSTGSVCDSLTPFTLKGTPEELDEGFLDAIKEPVETVTGLVSNVAEFKKSAESAEKKAKETASKPAASRTSATDYQKKLEEERKRKEEEAKVRKENFDATMAEAKAANSKGSYYTAEELLKLADTLTDDKKVKTEIAKTIKGIAPNKDGFLCNDNEETAKTTVEKFKEGLKKVSEPAVTAQPEQEPEQETENPEENAEDVVKEFPEPDSSFASNQR